MVDLCGLLLMKSKGNFGIWEEKKGVWSNERHFLQYCVKSDDKNYDMGGGTYCWMDRKWKWETYSGNFVHPILTNHLRRWFLCIYYLLQTDTASVLLEAMEYINFLHEQVKVRYLFIDVAILQIDKMTTTIHTRNNHFSLIIPLFPAQELFYAFTYYKIKSILFLIVFCLSGIECSVFIQ